MRAVARGEWRVWRADTGVVGDGVVGYANGSTVYPVGVGRVPRSPSAYSAGTGSTEKVSESGRGVRVVVSVAKQTTASGGNSRFERSGERPAHCALAVGAVPYTGSSTLAYNGPGSAGDDEESSSMEEKDRDLESLQPPSPSVLPSAPNSATASSFASFNFFTPSAPPSPRTADLMASASASGGANGGAGRPSLAQYAALNIRRGASTGSTGGRG